MAHEPNKPTADGWQFDLSTLRSFTEKQLYLGKYETGLYPDGGNKMPAAHRQLGLKAAAEIKPLDVQGQPDPTNGRTLALVLGHSNCRMYFDAFQDHLKQRRSVALNPRFELINAAVGGQQLPEIHQLKGKVWDRASRLLGRPGYSAKQVQVLFFHTTYHGWKNVKNAPPELFPESMEQMRNDLADVLMHCRKLYPNLRIAYLTADGNRHYTGFEPHVWREAFGFKWLIAEQIKGEQDPQAVKAPYKPSQLPWLSWGPYIWDNTWDRSYFTDGVHPHAKARSIFVTKYWSFLRSDPVARGWMFRPGPASQPDRYAEEPL